MYFPTDDELMRGILNVVRGGLNDDAGSYKRKPYSDKEQKRCEPCKCTKTTSKETEEKEERNMKKAKAVMTTSGENRYLISVDVPGYKGCELDVTFSEEQGFVVKANNATRGEFCYKSGTSIFEKAIDIDSISAIHEDGVVYFNFSYLIKPTIKEPIRFTF